MIEEFIIRFISSEKYVVALQAGRFRRGGGWLRLGSRYQVASESTFLAMWTNCCSLLSSNETESPGKVLQAAVEVLELLLEADQGRPISAANRWSILFYYF